MSDFFRSQHGNSFIGSVKQSLNTIATELKRSNDLKEGLSDDEQYMDFVVFGSNRELLEAIKGEKFLCISDVNDALNDTFDRGLTIDEFINSFNNQSFDLEHLFGIKVRLAIPQN